MPIPITMPRLSDTMESGTIIKWNVKEGDKVSAGDVVADIETDKATMEMAVYDDGTVAKIAVPEGKSVNIGTLIAVLAEEGEDVKEAAKAAAANGEQKSAARKPADKADKQAKPREPREPREDEPQEARAKPAPKDEEDESAQAEPADGVAEGETARPRSKGRAPGEDRREREEQKRAEGRRRPDDEDEARLRVSPVARRLAEEHEIDLRSVEGSGPGGRIIKRDIQDAIDAAEETAAAVAPSAKPQAARGELATRVTKPQRGQAPMMPAAPGVEERTITLSNMRQTIAKRLVESKQSIPHYQVTYTFIMDSLLDLRSTLNEQLEAQGVKLSVNDFLVKACALAMYQHPEFNSSFAGDHIEIHGEINIGIAISIPAERGGGLVVAVIRNADHKSLRMISYESKMLAEKARTRGLSVEEMSDSTFTISNLGMFGVDNFTAIINPPNVAILAVGAAIKRPVVRNGELSVGQEMNATLSCDHRVIDGAMAAEYLHTLKGLIENPATLMV